MDIANVTVESISAAQQAAISQRIAYAVMRQQIDNQKQIGEAMVQLIEAATSQNGGGRVDVHA
jgi:hypothetical protein